MGGFPVDICRMGYQLLCRTVGDDQLAHFPQGSRYLVSYPGTLAGKGLLSVTGEFSNSNHRGIGQKRKQACLGEPTEPAYPQKQAARLAMAQFCVGAKKL